MILVFWTKNWKKSSRIYLMEIVSRSMNSNMWKPNWRQLTVMCVERCKHSSSKTVAEFHSSGTTQWGQGIIKMKMFARNYSYVWWPGLDNAIKTLALLRTIRHQTRWLIIHRKKLQSLGQKSTFTMRDRL